MAQLDTNSPEKSRPRSGNSRLSRLPEESDAEVEELRLATVREVGEETLFNDTSKENDASRALSAQSDMSKEGNGSHEHVGNNTESTHAQNDPSPRRIRSVSVDVPYGQDETIAVSKVTVTAAEPEKPRKRPKTTTGSRNTPGTFSPSSSRQEQDSHILPARYIQSKGDPTVIPNGQYVCTSPATDQRNVSGNGSGLTVPNGAAGKHCADVAGRNSQLSGRGSLDALKNSTRTVRPASAALPLKSHSSKDRSRKKSVSPLRFSKEELEYFLPRKSFFSCHDKALRDAGLIEVEPKPRRRRGRSASLTEVEGNTGTLNAQDIENSNTEIGLEIQTDVGRDELENSMNSSEQKSPTPNKGKTGKILKKKTDEDIDFKLLTQYLKMVYDNPDEYLSMIQTAACHDDTRPVDNLVKIGEIYKRGHHGRAEDSILIQAVHELRPRFSDPGLWISSNKEKAQNQALLSLSNRKEQVPPPKQETPAQDQVNLEEGKTELEKLRLKVDKWMKTICTSQLIKAKELALREFGDEDRCLTKWWIELRKCHYIRSHSFTDTPTLVQ